jgi:hypothetical protein
MKFSLIAILGLFAAGSQAAPTIPGCSVDVTSLTSAACANAGKALNSTSGAPLTPAQVKTLCTSCATDFQGIAKALAANGSPACAQSAPAYNLECQISADGDYCLSKISSPAFSQILSSLTMAAFSGAPFSDQVCKSVDCCKLSTN